MAQRGTKVEIKLKEDLTEFADEYRLKSIITSTPTISAPDLRRGRQRAGQQADRHLARVQQDVTEEQ